MIAVTPATMPTIKAIVPSRVAEVPPLIRAEIP